MLSETVVRLLSSLQHRPDARRTTSVLPYCGICWEDELPEMRDLIMLSDDERYSIFRLFEIRLQMWRQGEVSSEDQEHWALALRTVPTFSLFKRLVVSDEDLRAQDRFEQEVAQELVGLCGKAATVRLSDRNGAETTIELTYDLPTRPEETKAKRKTKSR